MEDRLIRLREAKEKAALGGGKQRIEGQHQKGKLTAWERIDRLIDPGSFLEMQGLMGWEQGRGGEGVITGFGKIDGREVCIFAQDATVVGGSIGVIHHYKVCRTVERAVEIGVPVIGLWDSPGARTRKVGADGGESGLSDFDEGRTVFFPNTQASGVVPQIAAILGNCAGIAAYSPQLMDYIFMVDKISSMFVTGPRVTKDAVGEDIGMEELGGAKVHTTVSGVTDLAFQSEDECLEGIKKLLSFLPLNCNEPPPVREFSDDWDKVDDTIGDILPTSSRRPYDMHRIIERVVDYGDFFEIKPKFASEMIVGFGRLAGQPVGIVANQPLVRAGGLTIDSSDKQARFIRFCDAFNIPLCLLVDTPAYTPGSKMEHGGILRHGAKVLYAYCESIVPRVVVVVRKVYGGGVLGMSYIPQLGADMTFAWPTAELGGFAPEAMVDTLYREEIKQAADPQKFRAEKLQLLRVGSGDPMSTASERPHLHAVIEPGETRRYLIMALKYLKNKKISRQPKRHG
ncbi:acyl-CoA carboxylase subunit beta, partial [Chloroflexota bacterium]